MSVTSVGRPSRTLDTSSVSAAHAVAITVSCVGACLISLSDVPVPAASLAVLLAASVVVVGLPHGGLDHLTGQSLFAPRFGRWWPVPFLTGYLTVALLVLLGWWLAPVSTIVSFFVLSAAHFGDTESGPRWRATLFGGLPIWVPLLTQPSEVVTLLTWVTPGGIDVGRYVESLRTALIVLGVVAVSAWTIGLISALQRDGRDGLLDAVRLAATAAMLSLAPVLLGFAVCFCGWHSLRELGRLAVRAEPLDPVAGFRRVALAAAPLSLIAAGLATAAAWYASNGREVTPVVVQAVFLGLSAVAVPHIVLHAVADWAGADPLPPRVREVAGDL